MHEPVSFSEANLKAIPRISVDLLALKPLSRQREVYEYFSMSLSRFFHADGSPILSCFEEVSCPFCQTQNTIDQFQFDGFRYVRCLNCDSVYNNPRLTSPNLELMYSTGEYRAYFNRLTMAGQGIRRGLTEQRKFQQIASLFNGSASILDVGCGNGIFLSICHENGWKVSGVEPSADAVVVARQNSSADIYDLFFDDVDFGSAQFDCITFWGILEHIPDPIGALKKAVRLLRPGGVIVFEVPSADCLLMNFFSENSFSIYRFIENGRHLTFFSKKSLAVLSKSLNLKMVHVESNGLDLQTALPIDPSNAQYKDRLLKMQMVIDKMLLGDHYRVFLKK